MEYVMSFFLHVYGCVRARAMPGPTGGTAWGVRDAGCGVEWPEFKSCLFPAVPSGARLEAFELWHLIVSLSRRLMLRMR